jgi:hypothetical protein
MTVVSRTRRRSAVRWRKYSRRAVIISIFFGCPVPTEVNSMPSVEKPKIAPMM